MKATETYYLNKIEKLELKLARVESIINNWTKVGLMEIPADFLLEALEDVE